MRGLACCRSKVAAAARHEAVAEERRQAAERRLPGRREDRSAESRVESSMVRDRGSGGSGGRERLATHPSAEVRRRHTASCTPGWHAGLVRSARASGWASPVRQAQWREQSPTPSVRGCTVGPEAAARLARSSLQAASAGMRPGGSG